jgi:hypothetical protein
VDQLPELRTMLSAINDNYLNAQQDILETFIDRGQSRRLTEPAITPAGKRIPGLNSIIPATCPEWAAVRRGTAARLLTIRGP